MPAYVNMGAFNPGLTYTRDDGGMQIIAAVATLSTLVAHAMQGAVEDN